MDCDDGSDERDCGNIDLLLLILSHLNRVHFARSANLLKGLYVFI